MFAQINRAVKLSEARERTQPIVLRPRFHTFIDLSPSKLARRGARARAEAREGLGEARAPLDGGEQQRRGAPPLREGGTELAPMSTTTDLAVAARYSLHENGALLLKFNVRALPPTSYLLHPTSYFM